MHTNDIPFTILVNDVDSAFYKKLSRVCEKLSITLLSEPEMGSFLSILKTVPCHLVFLVLNEDISFSFINMNLSQIPQGLRPALIAVEEVQTLKPQYFTYVDGIVSTADPYDQLLLVVQSVKKTVELKFAHKYLNEEFRQLQERLVTERNQLLLATENLEKKVMESKTMYEAAKIINSTLNLDKALGLIIQILSGLLQANTISVMLLDPVTKELIVKAAKHKENIIGQRVKVGEGVSGHVAEEGRPFIVPNIELSDEFIASDERHYESNSFMCVPLKDKEEVIGVLNVTDKIGAEHFSQNDVHILLEMATQISMAVKNANLYSAVENLALKDGLTKLYNRHFFQKSIAEELMKAKVNEYHLSVAMLDIDFFKAINDTYGHQIGDVVLKKVAAIMESTLRKSDIACRYGGEEMIGILVGANGQDAFKIAEKVRKRIEAMDLYAVLLKAKDGEFKHMLVERDVEGDFSCLLFPLITSGDAENSAVERMWVESIWLKKISRDIHNQKIGLEGDKKMKISKVKITGSIGIASFPDDFGRSTMGGALLESTEEKDLLIYMSDKALYRAKKNGRNRVLMYRGVQGTGSVGSQKEQEKEALKEVMGQLKAFDEMTYLHSLRVSKIVEILARGMKLPEEDIALVMSGAMLHDVGKMQVSTEVLRKPDRLTPEEFAEMKTHTTKGAELIEKYPALHKYINAIRHHHEKWEGGGYPEGISGTRIPMEARVISVADSYDAMTSERHYRKLTPNDETHARSELEKNKEVMYDPAVVDVFVQYYDEICLIKELPLDTPV